MSFIELVQHLKKQFHDNKTLFQRHFEAFNFHASPPTTATKIFDKVNVLGDAFEASIISISIKIVLTVLALSDHTYHTE